MVTEEVVKSLKMMSWDLGIVVTSWKENGDFGRTVIRNLCLLSKGHLCCEKNFLSCKVKKEDLLVYTAKACFREVRYSIFAINYGAKIFTMKAGSLRLNNMVNRYNRG